MSRLDDAIGSRLMDSLLSVAGDTFTYIRDVQEEEVEAAKTTLRTEVVDSNGVIIESERVDFKMRTADLPFGMPQPGDRMKRGDMIWRAEPVSGQKCYYSQSPQMIRIYMTRIA